TPDAEDETSHRTSPRVTQSDRSPHVSAARRAPSFIPLRTVHQRPFPAGGRSLHQEVATMSAVSLSAAQEQFTAHLAAVENAARWAFRRRRRQDYEDALAEAIAAAWSAWVGLLRKGKDPVQVGVHGIASNAIRYVRNGRRLGNRSG